MFIHVGKPMFPFTSLLVLARLVQYTQKKKAIPFQQNILGAASVAVGLLFSGELKAFCMIEGLNDAFKT